MCNACDEGMSASKFYATLQSTNGSWNCSTSGSNDILGCGCEAQHNSDSFSNCAPFEFGLGEGNWESWQGYSSGSDELTQMYNNGANGGGHVLQ